jgi:transcriptional regulator GlxA family with amidase domain
MLARTFARRFKQETGTTPHRWLTHQRILSAQQLLERSDRPIDWIAESVGLQTAATLREHFRRILKTTPTAYRRAFFVTGRASRTTSSDGPAPTPFRRDSRGAVPPT